MEGSEPAIEFSKILLLTINHRGKRYTVCRDPIHNLDLDRLTVHSALSQEWRQRCSYTYEPLSDDKVIAVLFDLALGSFEWEIPF